MVLLRLIRYCLFLSIGLILFSCSDYNKLLKSSDYNKKYEEAVKYYENKDYTKSLALFEELVSVFRGTSKAEKIMYYYAYATYSTGDYLLAGYHFNNFVKTFPASDKTEECSFMAAYCYYLESPTYTLDQMDTKNAMKEMQLFLNKYPESKRKDECNELISKLHTKLEQKNYEISKQYYFLEDYKAAIVSFENFLKEFPDTRYREEVMYLIVKSNYLYAIRSIESKKSERFKSLLESYNKFASHFSADSKYGREVEDYAEYARKHILNP